MAISLTDLKRHLNITGTTQDNELQTDALDPAEAWVAKHTGIQMGAGTRTFTVYATGRSLLLPVANVASVTSVTDPDGLTVTVLARHMNLQAGIITVPYCKPGPWTVAATFDTAIPADLYTATLQVAAHLWETQRGIAPSPLAESGEEPPVGLGYAIPNRALELLSPYLLPGVA